MLPSFSATQGFTSAKSAVIFRWDTGGKLMAVLSVLHIEKFGTEIILQSLPEIVLFGTFPDHTMHHDGN